jgi:hypothetical protein
MAFVQCILWRAQCLQEDPLPGLDPLQDQLLRRGALALAQRQALNISKQVVI